MENHRVSTIILTDCSTTIATNKKKADIDQAAKPRARFKFTRLSLIIFIFVFIRGPLFEVEDLTELGWDRVSSWKVLKRLVGAGILEKYDRKVYGVTEDGRKWFRTAFGGGVNDATFAYQAMDTESWSKARLENFNLEFTKMWQNRAERFKQDPSRSGLTNEDSAILHSLVIEKLKEAEVLLKTMEKSSKGSSNNTNGLSSPSVQILDAAN
jgi:DNA-binding PadR family transcriptional regulator